MKMSYKIALIISAVAFVLAMLVFTGPTDPEDTTPDTTVATGQPEAAPRQSLRSDTSEVDQTPSPTRKPANTASSQAGKTLAQDVRSRIMAVENDQAETPVKIATEEEPVEVVAPNAIALTRTDTDTSTQTIKPKPEPAPAISRADLDAILGFTSTPTAAPLTTSTDDTNASDTHTDAHPGAAVAFAGGSYIVQPGDTLMGIAIKQYGDVDRWADIAKANFVDPTKLRVGQELRLPAKETLQEITEPLGPGPEGVTFYTIRPGDSLSTVAEKSYDDPTLWRIIYNHNRQKIGDNPNAIKAGMRLEVPPRTTGAR